MTSHHPGANEFPGDASGVYPDLCAQCDEDVLEWLEVDFAARFRTVRDLLWMRYAGLIESRIQAVLDYHGIPYHANQEYYNRVYFHILDRVWDPGRFQRNLVKFDRTRGSFRNWLLAFQVVNTVRDWLKCRDLDEGRSRLEVFATRKNQEVDYEVAVEQLPSPICPPSQRELDPSPSASGWLDGLPIREQALLGLIYLAYEMPGEDVIAWIAEQHGRPPEEMHAELARLTTELRHSDKFREHERVLNRIGVAGERAAWFQHLVQQTKEEFFRQGGSWGDLEACEEEALQSKLGELDEAMRQSDRAGRPAREAGRRRYAVYFRRYRKWANKLVELRRRYFSGKTLVMLPYRDLTKLLGVPEKTLRNRVTRLKKLLGAEED